MCTSMHSGGFELTKLTYTRLEDNLIRHRGDRLMHTLRCVFLCRQFSFFSIIHRKPNTIAALDVGWAAISPAAFLLYFKQFFLLVPNDIGTQCSC